MAEGDSARLVNRPTRFAESDLDTRLHYHAWKRIVPLIAPTLVPIGLIEPGVL